MQFEKICSECRGGFGTINYARWIYGPIIKWDIENQQLKRDSQEEIEVALKKFDNFVNLDDILNEMKIHLKTQFYGITQDPETHKYMMVLQWLWQLSVMLMKIHKLYIVHQDLHPGNILLANFKTHIQISDFGLTVVCISNARDGSEDKYIFDYNWLNGTKKDGGCFLYAKIKIKIILKIMKDFENGDENSENEISDKVVDDIEVDEINKVENNSEMVDLTILIVTMINTDYISLL
ncbi:hypothetical protein Glove_217g88 [Diversispora epigaea]|uniref:Protein kinase domain-containing protein n=1 Tax=Diversispora epigaea TaxID=1348612 RepID=A0A397IGU6_9GLOM|nr:hypothetical protein Glove_217g88 [Diversispora epigaea]